ncbi:MAG: ABC transporter ATP-binding protein [Hyphomonadaceae bacterium]|nr:ABC transporter ATP-binding protein [Hyphomonadaceae bacterium]OUX92798.1 MAG: ABC transporter ATP-binding protein [Hyphomonas sp. TMED17]CAI8379887.1 MAG: Polysialic acid transport ATP-binding protein KpsT [Hyphomonas sp. TMED17]
MLDLVNVSKSYKINGVRKTILSDFSFSFPTERNVAIMGRNGVGKSTLMRLLAGAELPDSGQIYRGIQVSWPLGFSGGLNGSMTGLENIRFVARIYNKNIKDIVEYVKDFSELGASLKLPIRTYSNGMRAKLAFGLSMAIDFDIYLIDEITAAGDPTFRKRTETVFQTKLNDSRVIMISHSEQTIKSFCDCGLLMSNDGIFFFDRIEDLLKEYKSLGK